MLWQTGIAVSTESVERNYTCVLIGWKFLNFSYCWFSALTLLVGRQEGHPACKKLSCGVLAWLFVWSNVQICIWPSWCHCHSLSLAPIKSKLVLPFWYQLTWVVPDKGPLNVCVRVCVCVDWSMAVARFDFIYLWYNCAFSALTLLVGRQEGQSACKKTEWWGAGVVICLERGADLHMLLLMPLPHYLLLQ